MTDDTIQYFRRRHRRDYLRRHEQQRRADLKAEGARRIDVTLRGATLDDYATVRRYIEGLNRLGVERGAWGVTKMLPDGRTFKVPLIRLSDTEVIKMALSYAADAMREEDERSRKQGLKRMLGDC